MTKTNTLTGKQARYLRSLGHSLKPLLQIGKGGISDDFLTQVRKDLEIHELIKIKIIQAASEDINTAAEALSERVPCHIAQKIGKTLLIYKPKEKDPEIKLPN